MYRRISIIGFAFLFSLFVLFLTAPASAEMTAEFAINSTTKECASIYSGDDCSTCTLPRGWKKAKNSCPEGYSIVDERVSNSNCVPIKSPFCCTENHAGSAGDCTDIMINDATKQCAFIDEAIVRATMPKEWIIAGERLCPVGYGWLGKTR